MAKTKKSRKGDSLLPVQRKICKAYGVDPDAPKPKATVSVAVATLDASPVQGRRSVGSGKNSGWMIFCGDTEPDPSGFETTSLEQLTSQCPFAVPFLCLPSGWAFRTDGRGEIEVWATAT